MKSQVSNALFGALDYAAYPAGMLALAPVVLRHEGAAEYGVWAVATAVVSIGGIVASGFGDANIQLVASARGANRTQAIVAAVRSMLGINLLLGVIFAVIGWYAAQPLAARIAGGGQAYADCLRALHIASVLILMRALETVPVSTRRAFERYGAAIAVSVTARVLSLVAAGVLAVCNCGVASIMLAAAVLTGLGVMLQFAQLWRGFGAAVLRPRWERAATVALLGMGGFCWLQATAAVIFSQVDRVFLGASMGAVTVASYALCVQVSQPLYGLTAAALHYLFPHLAARSQRESKSMLRSTVWRATVASVMVVLIASVVLLLLSERVFARWAGPVIAQAARPMLPSVIAGSALMGMSVVGTYTLLALGRMRTVAVFSIAGGALMLTAMKVLVASHGVQGIAAARIVYGVLALGVYIPLGRALSDRRHTVAAASWEPLPMPIEEGR